MHDSAEIGGLGIGAVGQCGGDDAGLQAQRAQRVELVTGQHDDPLRLCRHIGLSRGMAHRPCRTVVRISGQRVGCAGLVWPALIAQNTGPGDPRGAGDDGRLIDRGGRSAAELSAAAERGHHHGGQHGRRGCDQTRRRTADQHGADGNSRRICDVCCGLTRVLPQQTPQLGTPRNQLRPFVGPTPTSTASRDKIRTSNCGHARERRLEDELVAEAPARSENSRPVVHSRRGLAPRAASSTS